MAGRLVAVLGLLLTAVLTQESAEAAPPWHRSQLPIAPRGYWLVASDGGVFSYGAPFLGSAAGYPLAAPIVGIAGNNGGDGYWLAGRDGGIFTFDTPFFGSAVGLVHSPVVGIDSDTGGYVVAAADGTTVSFTANSAPIVEPPPAGLDGPVVGIGTDPDGPARYLVTTRGQVVPVFPPATNQGDPSGVRLAAPVVGITVGGLDGWGYQLAAADGGVFTYDTTFAGSAASVPLAKPVVGTAQLRDGEYYLVAADGGVFNFGGAPFYGSAGNLRLAAPVVGMAIG